MSRAVYEDDVIKLLNRGWRSGMYPLACDVRALPSAQPELIRCKYCKHSEEWYGDRRRCFLWSEEGVSVFNDGFCNYADMRGKQNE